jgi:ATP-dependent Clp protease ATP-binding subunit ClpC
MQTLAGVFDGARIILGIIRRGDSAGGEVLASLMAGSTRDLTPIETKVRELVKGGPTRGGKPARLPHAELPYSARAKRVLELAVAEATRLGHAYVGSQHLVLGLLAEGRGIGAEALHAVGITLERARAETVRLLGESEGGG